MSQIVIDSLQKQPVDASDHVRLIPPGAIKVADKTGADIFALRFNSENLLGSLNGIISSQGTGEYTCGILFQDDADEYLNGSLMFSSGKMAVSATGAETVGGICGNELAISGIVDIPLSGSLKVASKSATSADATGIYASATFESELALNMDVKADASKGTDATASGFIGETTTRTVSSKFKLSAQAKAGTGNAEAMGFKGSLVGSGQLGGTFSVKADASKGNDAAAAGVFGATQVAAISDKFKLNVEVNGGLGDATAYAFFRKVEIAGGPLSGTISLSAATAKNSMGTAKATAFYLDVEAASISDNFKLTSLAKYATTESRATGFANDVALTGSLGGTMTINSNAMATSQATGFDSNLQATMVSDKFKLTVTAKSDMGDALAKGFGTTDIADGLSGKINVSAISKSGNALASGGMLSSDAVFRTAQNVEFVVTAQTGSTTTASTAYGYIGSSGDIELEGGLAVTAKGGNNSTAIGVFATGGGITGSISGVVAVVADSADGVWSCLHSNLTISGAVYAGNKGNAVSIAKSLGKLIGTGKSAAGLNKNTAQAISLYSNSTLSLTDGSIVIGDVKLVGSGSCLALSSGAQLYGDIEMDNGSDISITIDGTLTKAAMVNLASAGAGVFAEGSGVDITIFADEATQAGRYVLLSGSDLTELSNVDFNTRFDLMGFDVYDLQVGWELDLGKTDTLTMILTDAPVGSSSALLSATDLNSASQMLASSSFVDESATSYANAWRNTLIA